MNAGGMFASPGHGIHRQPSFYGGLCLRPGKVYLRERTRNAPHHVGVRAQAVFGGGAARALRQRRMRLRSVSVLACPYCKFFEVKLITYFARDNFTEHSH